MGFLHLVQGRGGAGARTGICSERGGRNREGTQGAPAGRGRGGVPPGRSLLERDDRLAEVVRRLVPAYRPERIYLFGSAARGEAGPESDHDLLVVVPDDAAPERRQSGLAYQVFWGTGAAVDVVVWRRSAFERRARVACSLPATVLREGELVYAA
ncbi:MAG TPA: nucleotidyltransferase domain-containing protein [Actinomycetota bacterium]|nr:nucleotidyltransferase domain-containing protein [Actinomycetota bacterium]